MILPSDRREYEWPVPEGDWENRYYRVIDYAWLHLQFHMDICYMHLYVVRWGADVVRLMRKDFEDLVWLVRSHGGKRIVGMVGDRDRKWGRFVTLMGFPEPRPVEIESKLQYVTMMEV